MAMRKPQLALDFEEVITESVALFSGSLQRALGHVMPSHVYHYSDWVDAPISQKEYENILFQSISHAEWAETVGIVPGAVEGIRELLAYGVEIRILTARGLYEGELDAVRRVLQKQQLNLSVCGTAYQPKGNFLMGEAVALDDQLRELVSMPVGMHRLLFRRPHNEVVWKTASDGITPVKDWPHAVETIKDLLML